METILIIYVIGFFVTYYLFRKKSRKDTKDYSWNEVGGITFLSVIWPIAIIAYIFSNTKPPKFL